MQFEENKTIEKIGEKVGFLFSYFLFTTILFIILILIDKLPISWNYLHIAAITIGIIILGFVIKRLLK